jgi:hypothetical protein
MTWIVQCEDGELGAAVSTWGRLKREGPRDPPFQGPTTARTETGHNALADEEDDSAKSGFR